MAKYKSGYFVPTSLQGTMLLLKHIDKINSYKKRSYRIKYQRKIFGVADGDVMTLKSLIKLINNVINIKTGKI